MACKQTEKGSAMTAWSKLTLSGMGNSWDSCAGKSGAKPPVAARELPECMPGGKVPSAKCAHSGYRPRWQASHGGSMPRGRQESQGLRTTRSPTRRSFTLGPTRSITPTASCPRTWGKLISDVRGLSKLASMNTCLTSLPQIPQRTVRTTVQSSPSNAGSGICSSCVGLPRLR